MIHRTGPSWQRNDPKAQRLLPKQQDISQIPRQQTWQQHLQQVITDPKELLEVLGIDAHYLPAAIEASKSFPLRVPRTLLNRMQYGDINDPILKQVLPIVEELEVVNGYSKDPVKEQNGATAGLIHKYNGRMLLVVNGHCAVNCRYCFRRHFPYSDNRLNRSEWESALQCIADDSSVDEIIYSGGDPLASNDKQLAWLTQRIATIPHVKRLRIHTRLPVVIPERITEDTLQWMNSAISGLSTVMVLHINHANELQDECLQDALSAMRSSGITLLNQAVLLKGVNDTLDAQTKLSHALFESGILPYYLHVLDKVAGSAHFDISESTAKCLHEQMTATLSGYLVPKLVREIPDAPSKTAI